MVFEHVALASVAIVEAPERVTSAAIEAQLAEAARRIGLGSGMIEALTGVTARRFWPEGMALSAAAAEAARRAMTRADVSPAQIELIISTSVCKDYVEPSMASTVHGLLGLPATCVNFDVSNACLGFLNGMELAATWIERGLIDRALIVDAEGSRDVITATIERLRAPGASAQTLRDYFATLTLGSGAAAVVLTRDTLSPTTHRLRGGVALADTAQNHLCRGQADEMVTDATQLLKSGVALARQTFARARDTLGWHPEDLDQVVLHQVGSTHTAEVLRALEIHPARALLTYPEHGNIGPAAIPYTLATAEAQQRLYPGDRVGLMGIGSGLNCAMVELIW